MWRFVNPFARSAHHAEGVNIINSEGIAYHQHEVLYVIKPTNLYTLARDAIRAFVAITYNARAR